MKSLSYLLWLFFCLLAFCRLQAQTVIKQDGRFGIADEKGNVVVKPEFDTIWPLKNYTNTFFVLEKNKKRGYCYRVELDSIKWMPEAQRYWITSAIEFDQLITKVVGSPAYSGSFTYTSIAYKKNGLWGIMFVQTRTGSGDGIFPSAGFYVEGFGHLRIREAKYDSIYRIDRDAFYTTRLNGKYGFWEPTTNEVYEPEFDSIPIVKRKDYSTEDLPRHRFVKKNGKWGLIYLNEQTKKIEYKVPCLCNGLGNLNAELYYCMGQNDTLQFYSTKTKQTFKPLIEGKPITTAFYWRPWNNAKFSYQAYIGNPGWLVGTDSTFYYLDVKHDRYITFDIEKNSKELFPVVGNNLHEKTTTSVYVIDMQENKITLSFTDTTCSYFSGYESLIVKANYNSKTQKYTRDFYDDQTGILKFSITTPEQFLFMENVKKETRRGQTTWYKFTSYQTEKYENGKAQGYYNLTTKKFSKRRK